MKKLLILLLLSFLSNQSLAKIGDVYYCEWYHLVKIPPKISRSYDEGINTKLINEIDKKFTFLREKNQIILNSQDGFFNYLKIPVNFRDDDEYFSGGSDDLMNALRSFMSVPEPHSSTTTSNFYFNTVWHLASGYSIAGIAECTHY